MVILDRLLGRTLGSGQQEHADRNGGKKPQIVQGFTFQVSRIPIIISYAGGF